VKRINTSLSALLAAVALAACGGTPGTADDNPEAGSNRPTETAADVEGEGEVVDEEPTEEPTEEPVQGPVAFGQAFTYSDGLSVTVGPPTPYQPSDTSAGAEGAAAVVSFDVTIVNGTPKPYDPAGVYITMQSANTEATEVYDSENGLNGSPSTTLLPGREAKYRVGYGVADPADLVMEVAPGFEYEAAIFTNTQ
jgi:hypothetical protein